ncbi:DUF1622 domain-containing protein [Microterricola pindariensis]|uniref:DUF1622 domain-containing protein n=1 Tax=Microterricola pindariensis TaxID=478010 RepID=A0ABX5AZG7_9MICO|nr:DUF1622 domain-containing protein [Microterricola pindariensis]PPL20325.1 hypothetical protein GY24_01930 [Microterricola pindariensis]
MDFNAAIELIGTFLDVTGVAVIVIGAIIATVVALRSLAGKRGPVYVPFRRSLGRSILLGLELLVAADIIKTVALTPTFQNVAVLGGIVLIRTFLSFSLELEINGRWPWQAKTPPQTPTPTPTPAPTQAPTAEVLAPE